MKGGLNLQREDEQFRDDKVTNPALWKLSKRPSLKLLASLSQEVCITLMSSLIYLIKATESLLIIEILIVVYLSVLSFINIVKRFVYQNREKDTSHFLNIYKFSGEVSRTSRHCNARPTRDRAGASSWTLSPYKNQFNIEEGTWPMYQILSW